MQRFSKGPSIALWAGALAIGCAGLLMLHAAYQMPEYAITLGEDPLELRVDSNGGSADALKKQIVVYVTNIGRRPVRITGVQSSCSCTLAGDFSQAPIPRGGQREVPIEVHFPSYGHRDVRLGLLTDGPGIEIAEFTLRLQGPALAIPMVESLGKPIQLTTSAPGEVVEHEFALLTTEELKDEYWLKGLEPSTPESASVKLVGSETLLELPQVRACRRRYVFVLTMCGPDSEHQPILCSLKEQGSPPPARPIHLPVFRCSLVPDSPSGTF